jgi:hypothetical protein
VADKAGVVDRAKLTNKAYRASLARANKLLANNDLALIVIKYLSKLLLNDGIAIDCLIIYSLTKYFAIFLNDKRCFGICCNCNNELGLNWLLWATSGVADTADELDKLVVAKGCNELNELVVAKGCDELDELVVAEGHDELNELVVDKGHNEVIGCDVAQGHVVAKGHD